jgi:thioredoxin 1
MRKMNRRPFAGAVLVACAILALAAGGCGGGAKVTHIGENMADFEKTVTQADKPVLVDFFKEGCVACAFLESTIDQLAEEYEGRAVIASFKTYTFLFGTPCKDINRRCNIGLVPTVILFVDGKEKKRWIAEYNGDIYRKFLDEVVPPAPAAQPKAEEPAAKEAEAAPAPAKA